MLSLQSPKHDLLFNNISPSFRNKRIPSAHDNYSYSSNHNLKINKIQSPSKLSQKLKRRKSQYINSSSSYLDKNQLMPQKKKSSKSINSINQNPNNQPILNLNNIGPNTPSNNQRLINSNQSNNINTVYSQNIITQMNCLKNQYKQLKSAYQQLIQQKINNSQKMALIKQQNRELQAQLQIALQKINNLTYPSSKQTIPTSSSVQHIITNQQIQHLRQQNQRLKQKNSFFEFELDRIKKQCYKLLQAQKFKCKKLQQSLKEKDDLLKIFTKQNNYHCPRQNIIDNQQYKNFNNINHSQQTYSNNMNNSISNKNLILSKQQSKNISTPKILALNKFYQKDKPIEIPNVNIAEESLFISQDKSMIENQSQFISISLTSVMEESVCRLADNIESHSLPKPSQKGKQPLIQIYFNQTQSTQTVLNKQQPLSKRQKLISRNQNIVHESNKPVEKDQLNINMKKMRKQVHQKLQINLNHFDNKKESLMNLKTPMNGVDKKLMKNNKNSKSKRKQQDKQNNTNYYHGKDTSQLNVIKNSKKKQKNHSLTHK